MFLSRIAPAGALLLLSTVAGCTVTAAPGEDVTTSTEAVTSETFKLYTDAKHDVSDPCDIHTMLTLSSKPETEIRAPFTRGAVLYAHLYDEAVGYCNVHIEPDPRDYALLFSGHECGSTIYSVAGTVDGRTRDLKVTDHRTRVCKDLVPAKIVVEERVEGGEIRTYYSFDGTRPLPLT